MAGKGRWGGLGLKVAQVALNYTTVYDKVPLLQIKHNFFNFQYFFLLLLSNEISCNLIFKIKIDSTFSKKILKNQFIRQLKFVVIIHNLKGIKLAKRLHTCLSHLHEYKFENTFQDSLSPVCICGTDVESCVHFFVQLYLFQNKRSILQHNVTNFDREL